MSEVLSPFNIMAKPVCGLCNLDCRYCYYTMKPKELYPNVEKFVMTEEVLGSYTREYMGAMPVKVEFGWQGGEPLLAGKEFFRKAVEFQKQFGVDGQVVANAMQTNGTLLDDEWCEFLAENKFLVGISLDGPAQWHDTFRKDHAGNPTFHRAWAGLELLRKHSVEFNLLVTLNSTNAPHAGDIYRYFTNRGIGYLQFIPILERTEDGKPTDYSCTGEQFGRFMLDVFELWASRDIGKVSERLIDSVLHTIIYGKASTCCYSERCANAHVLEFNGDLYACDHFVFHQWRIGNIMDRALVDLLGDPLLEEFAKLKTELPSACRDCEFLEYCRGGCPKHHTPMGTDADRVNHFCVGYKQFFREALPELKRMAEYIKRGELPPLKAPVGEGAEERITPPQRVGARPGAKDRGVGRIPGRNDPCPCGSGKKFKNCCGKG
jgi:uncharacterized protein